MGPGLRKLIILLSTSLVLATIVGYLGAYNYAHVKYVLRIAVPATVALALLFFFGRFRKRRVLLSSIFIILVLLPLFSLLVGRLTFSLNIYRAQRFFERSIPAIEACRTEYGHYPETFKFSCSDAPEVIRSRCKSGVINDNWMYYPVIDSSAGEGFVINFSPPECACQNRQTMFARSYRSRRRSWNWAIVD